MSVKEVTIKHNVNRKEATIECVTSKSAVVAECSPFNPCNPDACYPCDWDECNPGCNPSNKYF